MNVNPLLTPLHPITTSFPTSLRFFLFQNKSFYGLRPTANGILCFNIFQTSSSTFPPPFSPSLSYPPWTYLYIFIYFSAFRGDKFLSLRLLFPLSLINFTFFFFSSKFLVSLHNPLRILFMRKKRKKLKKFKEWMTNFWFRHN